MENYSIKMKKNFSQKVGGRSVGTFRKGLEMIGIFRKISERLGKVWNVGEPFGKVSHRLEDL